MEARLTSSNHVYTYTVYPVQSCAKFSPDQNVVNSHRERPTLVAGVRTVKDVLTIPDTDSRGTVAPSTQSSSGSPIGAPYRLDAS